MPGAAARWSLGLGNPGALGSRAGLQTGLGGDTGTSPQPRLAPAADVSPGRRQGPWSSGQLLQGTGQQGVVVLKEAPARHLLARRQRSDCVTRVRGSSVRAGGHTE